MDDLTKLFGRYQNRAFRSLAEPVGLYEPFRYSFDMGGKRLRPMSLLICGRALGGRMDQLLPAALGVELFHNFTLMHDDIMDESDTRRSKPSIPVQFGRDAAILSGDAMMIKSYEYITDAIKRSHADLFAMEQYNKMALAVCEGQQMDMDFEKTSDVSLEEYIEMIGKKTAALFAFCLQCGSMLTTKNNNVSMKLYRIGMNAGVAFQVQDDYLDFYGDTDKVGKRKGGDIIQGKKSALVLAVLDKANEDDKISMLDLLNQSNLTAEVKISTAESLFNKYNVQSFIAELKNDFWQNAVDELDELIEDYPKLNELKEFLFGLVNREY